jgi:hypothetical protein
MEKELLFGALFNDLTATIVTALGANTVIHHSGSAVGAYAQSGNGSEIVGTTLVSSLLGDFVFRMCHCLYFLIVYFSSKSPFRAANGLFAGAPASSFERSP